MSNCNAPSVEVEQMSETIVRTSMKIDWSELEFISPCKEYQVKIEHDSDTI